MSLLPPFLRTTRSALAVLAATVLLGACGGSSRVENYVPTRIMSFGDELSLIRPDGSKHSINGFASGTTTPDCTVNPVWNQSLAGNFGLAFPQCKPTTIAVANGSMNAAQGATVDAIDAQINAIASTEFVPSTLVTIQGGMWDILGAYGTYKLNANRDAAFALLEQKGAQLAAAVNRVTRNGAGARVLYGTVPDLGYSPLAIADQANNAANAVCAVDCRTLLSELTFAFNEALRINVINDGRYAGLVQFEDWIKNLANTAFSVGTYGLLNNTTALTAAACTTVDTSLCTPLTLVPEAAAARSPSTAYLWASDRLPGPNWHGRVAGVAINRARNNPF